MKASVSQAADARSTMTLGRPVDPPLAIAFHDGANGSSPGSLEKFDASASTGRRLNPTTACSSPPTTNEGLTRAMMAENSVRGSFDGTGFGVAPSFHTANVVS